MRPHITLERVNTQVFLTLPHTTEFIDFNILDFKLIFGFKPRKGYIYKSIPNKQYTIKETITKTIKFEKERKQLSFL
jgi:hypothetical protein